MSGEDSGAGRYFVTIETPGGKSIMTNPGIDQVVRRLVDAAIWSNGGNMTRAAKCLGVDRRTLYRMVKAYAANAIVKDARNEQTKKESERT